MRPAGPRPGRSVLLVTSLLSLTLLAVIGYDLASFGAHPATARDVKPRGDLTADEKGTIELFERCSKSVVYISPFVVGLERTFFGYRNVLREGTGSGFVWDDDGHIVTNYHVIEGAAAFRVTLPDNTVYEAELVGSWADKDIAVLRIQAPTSALSPIQIGTSGDLMVGQSAYAIGNPYGLDFTLTSGVVSAVNREIASGTGRSIQDVIQTDAAINPGNSGGPLLDSAGRLIGMNTAIYSRSGGSAGIGFAIPVDTINRIVPQLIAYGRVIRPVLGVYTANDDQTRRFGLPGVLILSVIEGSAAHQAGLRPTLRDRDGRVALGDVIVAINDLPTPTKNALYNAVERFKVGEEVNVVVDRDGKRFDIPVVLQAQR